MDSLEQIAREVMSCKLCSLSESRRNPVPGEGPCDAAVMIVGEAPGYNEDLQGKPFVGSAGKLLDSLLESIDIERRRVFITNIVKCRPPKNRPPRVGERKACMPYLERQMRLVKPQVVCLLGNSALNALVGRKAIGEVHGKPTEKEGVQYLPLYHPAAALYDDSLRSILFEDFKSLKLLLER